MCDELYDNLVKGGCDASEDDVEVEVYIDEDCTDVDKDYTVSA